jgi:adenylyltransferase/sulfurtransferase
MTVTELKRRIDAGDAPLIVDVREPFEAALCCIPGARLIPLGELPQRLVELDAELDPAAEIVVHCKSGSRSARGVAMLREHGFTRAANLTGGILSWINEIDSSLQRY